MYFLIILIVLKIIKNHTKMNIYFLQIILNIKVHQLIKASNQETVIIDRVNLNSN